MERVGIYEAKSRLSELVDQVGRGKEITITKHGKAVAKLVRAKPEKKSNRAAAFKELEAFSKTVKLGKKLTLRDIRDAIEWGRK
jgi:prevent-host-death family protein